MLNYNRLNAAVTMRYKHPKEHDSSAVKRMYKKNDIIKRSTI